ncbi:MAG: NADH-quinone oxidoreductase subunit N [Polyangia bacterium]
MKTFDATQVAALAPLAIIIIAGLAVLLLEAFAGSKNRRFLMGFSVVACLIAFGVQYTAFVDLPVHATSSIFSGSLSTDRFSGIFGMLFLANAALVCLLAPDFLKEHGFEFGEFYALVLFGTAGMMIMASATDFLTVFIGIETMSLAVYVLTGSWRKNAKSSEGAMKYFLVGSFATAVLLYGMALVYGATQATNLAEIARAVAHNSNSPILIIGMLLILVAIFFKIAAVPFHMWAPDAYEGAPSPVTAFMAAGVKAAGFATLLRVFGTAFNNSDLAFGASGWAQIIAIVAALTMTVGNLAALRQENIKRMLAYSSVSHAGYLLIGVVAMATPELADHARGAIVFYLVTYTFSIVGAFGVVSWISSKNDERLQLDGWAGLGSRHPAAALAMTIFMLSFAGIPPTGGFFGKFYLFRAVLEKTDLTWLVVVAVINSMVATYYYLRVVTAMYFREVGREPRPIVSAPMTAAIAIACLVTLGLGLLPGWLLTAAQNAPIGR